jgi:hypothetical protein
MGSILRPVSHFELQIDAVTLIYGTRLYPTFPSLFQIVLEPQARSPLIVYKKREALAHDDRWKHIVCSMRLQLKPYWFGRFGTVSTCNVPQLARLIWRMELNDVQSASELCILTLILVVSGSSTSILSSLQWIEHPTMCRRAETRQSNFGKRNFVLFWFLHLGIDSWKAVVDQRDLCQLP